MLPSRSEAERLLKDAAASNPGKWETHSRVCACCAERIAGACGMDPDKAYILGLLHDIGRKFGVGHLRHVSDGYKYMLSLGYDEAAKACLTHSFLIPDLAVYIGKIDTADEDTELVKSALESAVYDDYDRLIQLCDALAGAEGVVNIEERMADVKARYGYYPQEKWDGNVSLLKYFGDMAGCDIYRLCGKN